MERGRRRSARVRRAAACRVACNIRARRINATGQLWARGPSQMDAGRGGFDAFRSMRRACR